MYQIKDHNIYLISDNSASTTTLIIFIKNIFHYQSHAFNLNCTYSFILQHHETLQYRYLYASNNEQLLKPQPYLLKCSSFKIILFT